MLSRQVQLASLATGVAGQDKTLAACSACHIERVWREKGIGLFAVMQRVQAGSLFYGEYCCRSQEACIGVKQQRHASSRSPEHSVYERAGRSCTACGSLSGHVSQAAVLMRQGRLIKTLNLRPASAI